MINHKHHLVENGTMLSCDASGCPTHGKPFLLAGGDGDPGGWEDDVVTGTIELCACSPMIRGEFVKKGREFCNRDGRRKDVYKLPQCPYCKAYVVLFLGGFFENKFCEKCGYQLFKDRQLTFEP